MALINEMFDEGDIMMLIDENYDDETNSYNDSSLVEEAAVDVEMDGDPDIDEDIYAGEGEDDFLDVSDQMAMQLADAEKNWAEKEIDDEVMDMIIDDEDDEMTEDDIQGYNDEYGTEDMLESSLDHLDFNDGYPEDADALKESAITNVEPDDFLSNLHLI